MFVVRGPKKVSSIDTSWPSALNTGVPAGTSLTPFSGALTTTSNGQIIQDLDITDGIIIVNHANVIVRRCRFNVNDFGFFGIDGSGGSVMTVEDCEIGNIGRGNAVILCSPTGDIIQRNNCYGFENGILAGNNTLVQDNYIHNLNNTSEPDPHVDGISVQGASNVIIKHNSIYSWDTSCVFIKDDFGSSVDNVRIEHNLMRPQPPVGESLGWDMQITNTGSGGSVTNISIINNVLETGIFGYVTLEIDDIATRSGNVDFFTGNPIPGG